MDLTYLRPIFARPGPWASVYLDATRSEENAEHQIELRWRALADRLTGQGADATTVEALRRAVFDHPYQPGPYGLAGVAADGEVALLDTMAAPPAADVAEWAPLPHAMPLVTARGAEVPYVRVVADRTGAEITGLAVGGSPRREAVTGTESYPISKVRGGGWSNPRYQRAAEETWKRNAGEAAEAVAELAAAVGAEVIVVGGDVHSAPLTAEQLPRRWRDRLVLTEGAGEELDEATTRAVAEVAARHTREAVDRYNVQRGHGTAGHGLADVVTRLQRGQADTVLLADDPSSTDRLWIGAGDPWLISVDAQTLRDSGVDEPQQVRADAALLRAIVGTDADLVLVTPDEVPLEHGIGAVLRYADGDTAAS